MRVTNFHACRQVALYYHNWKKSHRINLAIKIKMMQELQFLFNWMFRYMNIVLQDLIIITNFISKY